MHLVSIETNSDPVLHVLFTSLTSDSFAQLKQTPCNVSLILINLLFPYV